jgi:hypothetical protein
MWFGDEFKLSSRCHGVVSALRHAPNARRPSRPALSRQDAAAIVLELAREAERGTRADLVALHEGIPELALGNVNRAATSLLADRLLAAIDRGRLILVSGAEPSRARSGGGGRSSEPEPPPALAPRPRPAPPPEPVDEDVIDWVIWVELDPDDPKAQDDELILIDIREAEVQRVHLSSCAKEGFGVKVVFEQVEKHTAYTLIRDFGPDEGGGIDTLFIGRTPQELNEEAAQRS